MPVNGYTVGRDVSIDLISPAGPLRFSVRTGFSAKQETTDIRVKRADGITDHLVLPDGWTGSFDYERGNPVLDTYFANLEDQYYAGLNIQAISMTETITEPNGSLSQFRYERVVLKYADAGAKSGDQTVKQKIEWMASRRRQIA